MVQLTQKRVTQKDIARAADLSVAAVSMALKGNIALPASTIYRVKKIAAELGYIPDPALSALAAHRSLTRVRNSYSVLGYLTPDQTTAASDELFQKISARAEQLGFRLEAFSTSSKELSPQRLAQILTTRGIRGLILSPSCELGPNCGIDWERFSVVTLNLSGNRSELPAIVPDYQEEMRTCLESLESRGSSKIGLILDSTKSKAENQLWQAAYLYFHGKYTAGQSRESVVLKIESDAPQAQVRDWIEEHQLDTVVSNKVDLNSTLPHEITCASLCSESETEEVDGIKRDYQSIGQLAIETLNSLLQDNRFGTERAHVSSYSAGSWAAPQA